MTANLKSEHILKTINKKEINHEDNPSPISGIKFPNTQIFMIPYATLTSKKIYIFSHF